MSEWIYATVMKSDGRTPINTRPISVQIDKMEAKESSEYQGADPHFTYRMVTRQLPTKDVNLVQQRYYVIDQQIIDPETNAPRKYLIVSDPQPKMLMMEWSWIAYKVRGV